MPREIDFARLNLKDALDLAILIEEEAEERYHEFAEQMDGTSTVDAARFFRFMANNEKKHGKELLARRQARFGDELVSIHRGMLWDVEAPVYERAADYMSVREALEVALEAETKAHDYFAAALPHLQDPEVRALFDELRQEEVEHQALVRERLAALPADEAAKPIEFVDEPEEM